jgi:hypothetical protein
MLTDDELMAEVARRFRLQQLLLRGALARAAEIDWTAVAARVQAINLGEEIPADMAEPWDVALTIQEAAHGIATRYNPWYVSLRIHRHLPGNDLEPGELSTKLEDDLSRAQRDGVFRRTASRIQELEARRVVTSGQRYWLGTRAGHAPPAPGVQRPGHNGEEDARASRRNRKR